jgi:UDP-N-acetylmuramate--alanine ligase
VIDKDSELNRYKDYFLTGIGGAGMSAIAIVLKGMGFNVSGSDLKESRYTNLLKNEGITVVIGHEAKNLKNADAVIYSTAISLTNVELIEAKKRQLPIFTRGEVLSWILNSSKGIAITGTHGKTTTTSMISLIFRGLDLDPTIIIGGELNELGSNARFGSGEYIVAEACESDGTFLKYKPFVSVITNIEEDHMDYWKDFELLKRSFREFLNNTKAGGFIVIEGDEVGLDFAGTSLMQPMFTYGINSSNDIYAEDITFSNFGSSFSLIIKNKEKNEIKKYDVRLNVPGIHNIKNSLAALAVCSGLKLDIGKASNILQYFTGAKRRFEKRGVKYGAVIYDDYAHHPTEIKATLAAAVFEKKERIISVFQPHRYSRLMNMHNKFNNCFNDADILIITDVFGSGEQPIPGVTGKLLVDSLTEDGFTGRLAYIPKLQDVSDYLSRNIKKDDIVLIMGAGDITRVTEDLLKSREE